MRVKIGEGGDDTKLKKAYARIKAEEARLANPSTAEAPSAPENEAEESGDEEEPTPTEEAAPDTTEKPAAPPKKTATKAAPEEDTQMHPARQSNLTQKPGYFDRALRESNKRKEQREAREAEFERRRVERDGKIKERQRFRKLSAKAREVGPNGQRKLGRESEVMLEKVKRMMGQS
ncbi:hypothetical protein IMZ48_17750 [Candidatus Bathyarchaeota archaeon]|nr:hypothetical protein [Candidatus Bathyarchaeota archaeon]